jgi:predicted TIM-barrel fold metal-dependent hydrolase
MTHFDDDHRYVIVSADNHAGADLRDYKPYLQAKWHDEFDEWAENYSNPWDFVETRVGKAGFDLDEQQLLTGAASWHSRLNWDSAQRLTDMDADGVTAEVMYPNTAPPFMAGSVLSGAGPVTRAEYDRRWAGLQAHNRWLADFCAAAPHRRAGIAQIMLEDIDNAVAEVRAIKKLGLTGGILLPMDGPRGSVVPLYADALEPLWQVCAELDVPIHKHSSAPPEQPGVAGVGPGVVAIGMAERQFFNHRIVAQLIFAGVLERYPKLKVVMSESGAGWVPGHLRVLDSLYVNGRNEEGLLSFLAPSMAPLSLKPSEYFARNFYLGASLFTVAEAAQRHDIGIDRIMWSVDYPHSEGTFPYTRQAISLTFAEIPREEVAAMLGLTAVDVFGFDLQALQKIADRVGPTAAEVGTPPTWIPAVPRESMSPVFDGQALADR